MTARTTPAVGMPPSEAPPRTEVGILGWLRANLFSSVLNTLLTVLAGIIAFVLLRLVIRFILFDSDWTVVTTNLVLFAIGQYPRDEAWRTLVSLILVLGLIGATVAWWRSSWIIRRILLVLWLLSPVVITVLLYGFVGSELLPRVRTDLWQGLLLTIILSVSGIVASFPLGVLLALGRRSNLPILKLLSTFYIEVIRGVPLITVLFMAQVMAPLFLKQDIDTVVRAIVGITLFSAAYLAENIRGGLQAIPRGQIEAAQALGFSPLLVTSLIILPQAIRIVIPAIVGQFISLFKDTTLVSIITLIDLLGIAKTALAQSHEFQFHKTEVYLFLAAIYFVFSYLMSSAARRIESATSRMGGTRQL